MNKVKLKWEVADGYIGGNRPQYTTIHLSDFDEDETDESLECRLGDIVQEEFMRDIYPVVQNMEEVIQAIKSYRELQKEEEDE